MKKFYLLLLLTSFLLISSISRADEGMWIVSLVKSYYNQMEKLGLKLAPEQIYNEKGNSLKDAIITLDHGMCTGEIVSPYGLFLTNHHCGYEEIQNHSRVDANYLEDGFWAYSLEEELPNPGKTVSFLVRIEDVTSQIMWKLDDRMDEEMRNEVTNKTIAEIEKKASENGKYEAKVVEMFEGNQYMLFVYITYRDVRLVGAPPSSIGKFGGDTDNWMWPRHTGDFTIFRIYAAPDGSPADYSVDNVPLKTNYYLKINISGIKEGDFTMILGYPGNTRRYLTTAEIKEVMENENAIRYSVRTQKLSILKQFMDQSPVTKIQYASKYAESANYWKYSEGQNLGLERLKVIERTKNFEKDFQKWINSLPDKNEREKYKNLIKNIANAVKKRKDADAALNYWFEAIYQGSELISFVLKNYSLIRSLNETGDTNATIVELEKNAQRFFKDFDPQVDKAVFEKLLEIYLQNVKPKYYGEIYPIIRNQYHNSISFFAQELYSKSIYLNKDKFFEAIENKNFDALTSDVGFDFTVKMLNLYWRINDQKDSLSGDFRRWRRLYMKAYMKYMKEKQPDKQLYPDANSTMRLTYGTVGGYSFNGKKYNYYTTFDEYIAKENPKNEEFYIKPRTKELYILKNYGDYAVNGTLYVNFITNNDITGGNSGSPVLNANGELIGIAFDGNWEGMSGDIAYEPNLQKTICVDIRFVLWTIDKYANAQNILNELTIVK